MKNVQLVRFANFSQFYLVTPPNVPSMSTSKKIKTEKRQLEDTTYTSSPSAGKRQRSNVHENEVPFANANEILSTNEGTSEIEENDETRKSQSSNVQDTTGPIENSVEECSFSPGLYHSDGDLMFLLNFHEFLQQIATDRKLQVRAAIANAITDIIVKESRE